MAGALGWGERTGSSKRGAQKSAFLGGASRVHGIGAEFIVNQGLHPGGWAGRTVARPLD